MSIIKPIKSRDDLKQELQERIKDLIINKADAEDVAMMGASGFITFGIQRGFEAVITMIEEWERNELLDMVSDDMMKKK